MRLVTKAVCTTVVLSQPYTTKEKMMRLKGGEMMFQKGEIRSNAGYATKLIYTKKVRGFLVLSS